ncbi:hypothetical protein [Motilibacter deserti]|uniref:DUF1269 domain-containing protein n=1 Tax=Motilibacter deserti TaxID=2714956 RepID=A0ABX0GXC3_9ACTN|nr:hypothetical protein [Motilibacter deserti]NHC15235.1 hypothetical protein [Motilibacter deserti]
MIATSVVATCDTLDDAEAAAARVAAGGLSLDRVSVIAREPRTRSHRHGLVTSADRSTEGVAGAWAGGLFAMLAGTALVLPPTGGPLLVLGPLALRALVAAESSDRQGIRRESAVATLLRGIAPEADLSRHLSSLEAGRCLVALEGDDSAADLARQLLADDEGWAVERPERRLART